MALFDKEKMIQAARDLRAHTETTFAVFLDAQRGWKFHENDLQRCRKGNIEKLGFSDADALAVVMAYHAKDQDGKNIVLHQSSVAETLARVEQGGTNHAFLANMCAVSLYEFWEGQARAQIADAFFGAADVVTSQLFGELRVIRHCILHCRAIADERVARCTTLNWFRRDERIAFSGPRLFKIVHHVRTLSDGMEQFANGLTSGYLDNGAYIGPLDEEGLPLCPVRPPEWPQGTTKKPPGDP